MSRHKTSGSAGTVIKSITEIVTSVGALMAYVVAVFGAGDIPYPKTTSLLTILATSILVVNWRWSQLGRKKKNASSVGGSMGSGSKSGPGRSLPNRILDVIRKDSRENYSLSLRRRRLEVGVLFFLILFTIGWSGANVSGAVTEFTKNPALTCSDTRGGDKRVVLIADLLETNSPQPQLLISDKIYEALVSQQEMGRFNVCRLADTIQLSTQALEKAEEYKADIVIWGRTDLIYEIHLEVPALSSPDRKLSELSAAEAASVEFQFQEPERIAYVTQFVLSELLLLDGKAAEAQVRLADMLASARLDELHVSHPQDLADGYFLLGLFYDPGFSSSPDMQKSVEAYTDGIDLNPDLFAAYLNRGLLLRDMGRLKEAFADFTFLIDNDTPLKGSGYINRALLQDDPDARLRDLDAAIQFDPAEGSFFRGIERMANEDYEGAITDFEVAVKYDPFGYYNHHLLGQAQLYHGDYAAARQTYVRIVPYLTEETRDQVLLELEEAAEYSPEIKPTVDEIIRALQAARLE